MCNRCIGFPYPLSALYINVNFFSIYFSLQNTKTFATIGCNRLSKLFSAIFLFHPSLFLFPHLQLFRGIPEDDGAAQVNAFLAFEQFPVCDGEAC